MCDKPGHARNLKRYFKNWFTIEWYCSKSGVSVVYFINPKSFKEDGVRLFTKMNDPFSSSCERTFEEEIRITYAYFCDFYLPDCSPCPACGVVDYV